MKKGYVQKVLSGDYNRGIILVFVIGLLLRVSLALIHQPAGDSCWHIEVTRFFGTQGYLPTFEPIGRELFTRPPLFHILGGILYFLFSIISEQVGRASVLLINPLLSSLSIPLVYIVGKKLFDKKIGVYSALIYSVVPLNIYFGYLSFIDETVAFFSLLSIALMLHDRFLLSSISAGLAMLSKINGAFVLIPLVVILLIAKKKSIRRKAGSIAKLGLVAFIINLPWYIRNYLEVGNPVWPFMNFIFNSPYVSSDGGTQIAFSNLSQSLTAFKTLYLTYFGVPNGDLGLLSFVSIPAVNLLIALWLIMTIIFCIPMVIGLTKVRKKETVLILGSWLLAFLSLILVKMVTYNPFAHSRHILPATPVLALIGAVGLCHAMNKSEKAKRVILLIFVCISIVFIGGEFTKAHLSSSLWSEYDEDFMWIKNTIPDDSLIFAPGQCFSYNFEKQTTQLLYDVEEWDQLAQGKASEKGIDYIWINQNFPLDSMSRLPDKTAQGIKNHPSYSLIYQNNQTETQIYKVN